MVRPDPVTSARVALLACGFATAVAQAVLLREAMTALAGSELAWGVVLGMWLAGMALGSRLGVRHGPTSAAWAPALVLLLAAVGVVLLRAAPALTGLAGGETLATWRALWVWALAVLPTSLAGGLAFPLLAHALGRRKAAGAAYALEAAGALAGGVIFTFLLAPLGTAPTMCLCLALVVSARIWILRPSVAVAVAVAGVLLSDPASHALASATWRLSGRVGLLADWTQTRHQRLELTADEPASIYADGCLLATYPDPYRAHPRAHLLMLLHDRPARVLAVGAAADGSLVAMLAHPVERVDVVEDDPDLPGVLSRWFGGEIEAALSDPRVVVHRQDAVTVVRRHGPWDLILLLDGDPTTVRRNRTRTEEFFHACSRALTPDGVLAIRVGVGDTYLGGAAGRLLQLLAASLDRSFPEVLAVPGPEVILLAFRHGAGDTVHPDALHSRWIDRGLADPTFPPEMIELLLDPPRAADLLDAIGSREAANTIDRPRAVLVAAGLAEGRGQPPLLRAMRFLEARSPLPLAVAVFVLVILVLGRGALGSKLGLETAAAIGLTSMAWWLLLLGAWQATAGSVYSQVGALSAALMGGLAAGAWWGRRMDRPSRALPWLLLGGAALSAVLASGLPTAVPRLAVPPLLALGGAITGAAFPGIARLAGGDRTRTGAGLAFAADEAGAAVAALVVGLLAIPWAGLRATAAGVGALDLAVAAALLLSRRTTTR